MGLLLRSSLVLLAAQLSTAYDVYQFDDSNNLFSRPTMVHLFEWRHSDVARECEDFLQYNGYGAVQVSPPNEHIMIEDNNDIPWYVRYQPVSYRLNSRSGNDTEFKDMVNRCNKVGVRIIVDAVLNHMVGVGQKTGQPGRYTSGSSTFDGTDGIESFPAVPYGSNDFHDFACHGDIQGSDYQNNANNVRNCRLSGLLDINQGTLYVQSVIRGYLNYLISIGVAGFRLDASKHMFPRDLETILEALDNVRADIFGANKRPFVVHEVIDRGGESVKCDEYVTIGRYTNFNFGSTLADSIWKHRDTSELAKLGPGYGYGNLDDHDVLNFVDNHDNQRDDPPYVLTYKNGDQYRMGVSYMLAWAYGYTRVMSSFYFSSHDQGPPNLGKNNGYKTASQTFNPDNTCSADSGWVCEHRWPTIREMARFRGATQGRAVAEIVTESNRVAFARESTGFFALNNRNDLWNRAFDTTMPQGSYCDQYDGALNGAACTGARIEVGADGKATVSVPPNAVVAFSTVSRIGGAAPTASPPNGNFQKTVVFIKRSTQPGQNVFIRGGITTAHTCSPGPYGQATDPCAIRIIHNTTAPWMFDEYLSWSQDDEYLDFEGDELRQGTYDGKKASGTPLAYSTDDPSAVQYQPLNKYGPDYWMVQFLMDCDKTQNGWFELKGYVDGWEKDIQSGGCGGSAGGSSPIKNSKNHAGKCGNINVYEWNAGDCIIENF